MSRMSSFDFNVINTDCELPVHHSPVIFHEGGGGDRNSPASLLLGLLASVFFALMNLHIYGWCTLVVQKSEEALKDSSMVTCAVVAGLTFGFLVNLLFNREYLRSGLIFLRVLPAPVLMAIYLYFLYWEGSLHEHFKDYALLFQCLGAQAIVWFFCMVLFPAFRPYTFHSST